MLAGVAEKPSFERRPPANDTGKIDKELFRAIAPLKIKWIGCATLPAFEDDEFLDLLAKSGCLSLNLGFESLSPTVIKDIKKHRTNNPDRYPYLIERVHDHGISIIGIIYF